MTDRPTDWRDFVKAATDMATAAATKASEAISTADGAAQLVGGSRYRLGAATLTFTSVVSINLGSKRLSVAVSGALTTDHVSVYKAGAWPDGYALLGPGYVATAGFVEVDVLMPPIALNAAGVVKLPVEFFAIRTPTT